VGEVIGNVNRRQDVEQGNGAEVANDLSAIRTQMALRWYALRVKSGKEKRVQDSLAMLRVENRLPTHLVNRRKNRRRPGTYKIHVPLMVGYVFVGFPPGPIAWDRIRGIHNVLAPVFYMASDGERRYAILPASWEDDLNPELLDPDRELKPSEIFGAGDVVTFRAGGFMGVKGHVIDADASEARILIELFNSTREIPVPLTAIKKAA
jgi:transcription antitermination factor NusG